MVKIKNKETEKLSVNEVVGEIYKLLNYSLSYDERIDVIEDINTVYGEVLEEYYSYYKGSNLKVYSNRGAYDKICGVFDKMSEYILFSDGELDDTVEDEYGLTAKDRRSIYTFSQESNLKTLQAKQEISYSQYVHLMNNKDENQKIRYDDQNHAIYTLKDFEHKMKECPYVEDYYSFNRGAREIIERLDSQLSQYLEEHELRELPRGIQDEPLLTYTSIKGVEYEFTYRQLMSIKRGIGYSKNNSKEIDQDIMAIYREWFKPVFFQSVTKAQEFRRRMNLDFMDREHVAGLIKASCLTGEFRGFDDYVEKLDELVGQADLTEMELRLYRLLREGKGLELDFGNFERNMVTITECAKILGISEPRGRAILNSMTDKITDKYEELYEDRYFTYIARGTYKKCSKCEEIKLANERYFGWDKTNSRWKSQCKKCILESKPSWNSVKSQ